MQERESGGVWAKSNTVGAHYRKDFCVRGGAYFLGGRVAIVGILQYTNFNKTELPLQGPGSHIFLVYIVLSIPTPGKL